MPGSRLLPSLSRVYTAPCRRTAGSACRRTTRFPAALDSATISPPTACYSAAATASHRRPPTVASRMAMLRKRSGPRRRARPAAGRPRMPGSRLETRRLRLA
eukprot:6175492-Pleurochrysis_carterae.AAC.3